MLKKPEPIELPRDVLDRVNRVYALHQAGKTADASSYAQARSAPPGPFRVFTKAHKTALPTNLIDVPAATLAVMRSGLEALPESQIAPPQNLRTLATWLHLAAGLTGKRPMPGGTMLLRSNPSGAMAHPCEIYIAAFAIEGLEPGLHHFCPREFSLRQLRDGDEALSRIKRGRPDLEFIKNTPGAVLVSTVFARSAARFGLRGSRYAPLDTGHLVQNLALAAAGLGIKSVVRLKVNENNMRELVGVAPDAPFNELESVQAMVVWNDPAKAPFKAGRAAPGRLAPLPRPPEPPAPGDFSAIAEAHRDCVAPGVAIVEIKPPLTDLTPLPTDYPVTELAGEAIEGGKSLRDALLERRSSAGFARHAIRRDHFRELNRLSFRGGSHFPVKPAGPHVGLVRPFWLVQGVSGVEPGVWYYHPPDDLWSSLQYGEFHVEARYLGGEQEAAANACAVCFMAANLHALMTQAGPDAYRTALIEAGMCAQRIHLAATAMELGSCALGEFYDDEARRFLGFEGTGWEVLHALAVGVGA